MSYALKFINPYKPGWNPQNETQVLQVIQTMADHPNMLKYFGKFNIYLGGYKEWLIICTEVCTGSLQNFLQQEFFEIQNDLERIATFWDILRQILKGWRCCRYNQPIVIHRDIKMSNSKLTLQF